MDAMGLDVARGGKDATVAVPRHDNWYGELISEPGADTPDGEAAANVAIRNRADDAPIHVDLTGVGSSPYDVLRRKKVQVIGFVAGGKSTARTHCKRLTFFNKRAESWWLMREDLDPKNGLDVALPPGRMVRADLASARYSELKGKIKVEPKDEIIKRLGRSPDEGEAVILARYQFTKRKPSPQGQVFKAKTDFNV